MEDICSESELKIARIEKGLEESQEGSIWKGGAEN
jgi:hypothetical protein